MHESSVEAVLAKGVEDGLVIGTGAFDGDDEIAEIELTGELPHARDDTLQIGLRVREAGGFEQDLAIEIAEEQLGLPLGAIDADDAKMFGSDSLHALLNLPLGFDHEEARALVVTTPTRPTSTDHKASKEKGSLKASVAY